MIITGKKYSKPAMSRVINGDVTLADSDDRPEKFRLDHLLVQQHPEFNRSTLQQFIKSGYVTVDGAVVRKANTKLLASAKLELHLPDQPQPVHHPEIIFENPYVKVLNKPAGLLSMKKGDYCPEPTLENYGLLVHRLDRDTSGVVILAKDPVTQKFLRRQFQERKAHKLYYAIVAGHPKLAEANIDLPIIRNLKHPTTFMVDASGKPSQTYYHVIQQTPRYSLLKLSPKTGRTHQLRVHLKYLGTPIVGDRVYSTAPADTTERLYLHAGSLEITIPDDHGQHVRRTFTAPLPPEFQQKLQES